MRTWPAVGVATALALSGCSSTPAAGCAGPQVTLSPPTLVPGEDVRVQAEFLWTDCYDTGQPGTPPPRQDVAIDLDPAGSVPAVRLAEVDADPKGRIDLTVRVPEDTPAGAADLVIGGATRSVEVATP